MLLSRLWCDVKKGLTDDQFAAPLTHSDLVTSLSHGQLSDNARAAYLTALGKY